MPTPQLPPAPIVPRSRITEMSANERRRAIAEILAVGVRRYLKGVPLPEEPPRQKRRSRPNSTSDSSGSPPVVR